MFPHSIMFHHFHDEKHYKGQGSITANDLERFIKHYGPRILNAEDFISKAIIGDLKPTDVCFSFDDSLLCQYDIARPVLNKHGIKAFFFCYSKVISGEIENLEVYRKFRTLKYKTMNDFYLAFEIAFKDSAFYERIELLGGMNKTYLSEFPFYTEEDRKFRYIRDKVLNQNEYEEVMDLMLGPLNIKEYSKNLWMEPKHLKALHKEGHLIGLHSHSHPTKLKELSMAEQKYEYETNFRILKGITKCAPISMSHPCNSYDQATLSILKDLGILIGFRSNMSDYTPIVSNLEILREDHANVMKELK